MFPIEQVKKNAAVHALKFLKPGMRIGLGTGSTMNWFIKELGKLVSRGFEITAVSTSQQTTTMAKELNIQTVDLNTVDQLDLDVDGADEIDSHGNLIKGGGGAFLQEKIVASAANELIIIADSSKLVKHLGKFPLPVEVIPFGWKQVQRKLTASGLCKEVNLRKANANPFVTDHGNYILDCKFEIIEDPLAMNSALQQIPGVVDTGLFIGMTRKAVIGYDDGRVEVISFE